MGLLDDAIREHLELKRRRGADSEEVTRQEQEALGAPQRAEFAGARPADDEPAAVEAPAPERELAPEPEPEPEPAPAPEPEPDIPLDEATVEYAPPPPPPEAPEEEPAPPRDGEDDVLEETPDFLQETPEHDRLWFEQKPPRDFDLDR
jgi:hypothetical protein